MMEPHIEQLEGLKVKKVEVPGGPCLSVVRLTFNNDTILEVTPGDEKQVRARMCTPVWTDI